MIDFTKRIKEKGYTVDECRKVWGYSSATWSRHVNDSRYHARIECLINGLSYKADGYLVIPKLIPHLSTNEIIKNGRGE